MGSSESPTCWPRNQAAGRAEATITAHVDRILVENGDFGNWHLWFRSTSQLSGNPTISASGMATLVRLYFPSHVEAGASTVPELLPTRRDHAATNSLDDR
jgi:hypothetical protein